MDIELARCIDTICAMHSSNIQELANMVCKLMNLDRQTGDLIDPKQLAQCLYTLGFVDVEKTKGV